MRKIPLAWLEISDRGKKYVNEALNDNRLSYGPFTHRFEKMFAELHGCKHAIFMASGTCALQVSLAALKEIHGYRDGDEVLVPATTFIATSNIVLQNGMNPVFVDVDPETFNIDPKKILAKITKRTRCILPVHLFGLPANMTSVMEIAKNFNLQVIEDSCETMFANHAGKSVGSFGDLACFSTYIAHLVVGGIGGIVTTNNEILADLARSFMAHGRDSIYLSIDDDDNLDNLQTIMERRYKFDRVGYSYRPTEMEAAIVLSELERWEDNINIRRWNAENLTRLLTPSKDFLQLPTTPVGSEHSFMMFPFVVKDGIDREKFLLHLERHGIETRYLLPLLSQPIYKKMFPGLDKKYPVSQKLARQGAFVGIHQGLTLSDILYIANTINRYFGTM